MTDFQIKKHTYYFFRDVSMEEVMAAARCANIHSFVSSLPSGYHTRYGSCQCTVQRIIILGTLVVSVRYKRLSY
jgi:ABC-type multidrug transport system fused ATPase/permease subunit